MGLTAAEVGRWTPIRIGDGDASPFVDWCHMAGIDFTEPFLDDGAAALRHPFRLLFRHRTPLHGLARSSRTIPTPDRGNHSARLPVRIDAHQPGAHAA